MKDLNKDQEAQNSIDNQDNNQNEHVTKPSYISIYRKEIKLITTVLVSTTVLFIILFAVNSFINNDSRNIVNDAETIPTNEDNKQDNDTSNIKELEMPTIEREGHIAIYIKDKSQVWVYDINENSRQLIISVPQVDNNETITAAAFKSDNEVSYAYCPDNDGCIVQTLDLDTKGIKTEYQSEKGETIRQIDWGNEEYLGLIIENQDQTSFVVQAGTVENTFNLFNSVPDTSNINTKILFDSTGETVIFSAESLVTENAGTRNEKQFRRPIVEIFKINGLKIDQVLDAKDPIFVTDEFISYTKGQTIFIKKIAELGENIVTDNGGNSIEISPDKSQYVFWKASNDGSRNITMSLYDIQQNFTRNILRGIILPKWVTNTEIIGIKSESCLSNDCLLFEFQTAELIQLNIDTQATTVIDRGVSFRDISVRKIIK